MAQAARVLEASADLQTFRCAQCGAIRRREPMAIHLQAVHGFGSTQTTLEIDDAVIRAYQPVCHRPPGRAAPPGPDGQPD